MSKLQRGIKKFQFKLNDFCFALGIKKLTSSTSGRRILVYHGVTSNARKDINARFISTYEFEKQLLYFKKHFHLVSLEEYKNGATHPDKLTLTITFDDGYLNNYTEVLPLIEKHKTPIGVFITTIQATPYSYLWADLLDMHRYTGPSSFTFRDIIYQKRKHEYMHNNQSLKQLIKEGDWIIKKDLCELILENNSFLDKPKLRPYFQLMNEQQIGELAKSKYVTIGSHGFYHNCLSKIHLTEAKKEFEKSKAYLEKITRKEVRFLAYPDGDYNEELVEIADQIGYQYQLVVDYNNKDHINDSRLANRFGINPYIGFKNQIQCIIDGKY